MFNILVVEDNPEFGESIRKCLLKIGCDVTISQTAEDGMEQLKDFQYDAVFASLCLHGMGGRGLARWVKTNGMNGLKFFITTSWKGDMEQGLLRFDGIHDVIRKPFRFTEVRDKVLEHLG